MCTTLHLDVGGSDMDGNGLGPNWLNYWAMGLRPLWTKDAGVGGTQDTKPEGARQSETSASAGVAQDVVVVICNRFGREWGVHMGCPVRSCDDSTGDAASLRVDPTALNHSISNLITRLA